jgi:hypothetical protein
VRAAVLVFLPLKLVAMAGIEPSVYPDGETYRTPGSWLDFSLTSLDGDSVRPWGVTIWMALWPGDVAIEVAQTVLSFVVWSALALVVAAGIRQAAVRRVFVVLLLLLACTAQVSNWDGVMQGDSVSISSGVLALAMALRLGQAPSWGRAGAFLAAALWFSMTRPNLFPILVVWALGMVVIGIVRRQVLLWAGVAGGLVLISVYTLVYNVRTDVAWDEAYGHSKTTVAYAYPLGVFNPVASSVLPDLRQSDAPRCMIPESPDAVSRAGTTLWADTTADTCPGMDEWASQNWYRWWASWLLRHPGEAWQIITTVLPDSLSPSVWGSVNSPVPTSVSQLFFGSTALPQDALPDRSYRTHPVLLWLAAAVALAIVGATRGRGRHRDWTPDAILALAALGAVASAISSALIIQTAPFEVAQESLGAAAVLIASAVTAVGLGLDRAAAEPEPRGERPHRRRSAGVPRGPKSPR